MQGRLLGPSSRPLAQQLVRLRTLAQQLVRLRESTDTVLHVDLTRVTTSRVRKFWHEQFRVWLLKELEAEKRKAWACGIKVGYDMGGFIDLDHFLYYDDMRAQHSLYLRKLPLFRLDFVCREGKGKNKKGLAEIVALYAILPEYRRMLGVAKTAAKQQAKKTRKKIVGVPPEDFVHPHTRSAEQSAQLAVWKFMTRMDLLLWLAEQHPRMLPKPVAAV